nr:hypothetical protein [Mycobacterium uberis]
MALNSATTGLPVGRWTVLAAVDGDDVAESFAREGAYMLQLAPGAVNLAAGISVHQLMQAVVDTGAAHVRGMLNGDTAVDVAAVSDILQQHVHDNHLGTELVVYCSGHHSDALLIGVE